MYLLHPGFLRGGYICYTEIMAKTFFFYDLETSGLNPRQDRIMQFAGQRTTLDLQPIGDPINILVRLDDDTLPSPDALMVTGITPQKTVDEGYSEAEFCQLLMSEFFTPETIIVGFNNVRFDDEFIRYTLWRNFYDPYEWAWKDGRSRWDLLDVVRMTRALRPEGIQWPLDSQGQPTNRLELITTANGIAHENAHDALSDVTALIAVTALIRQRQPQLFEYLLNMRDKRHVQQLVSLEQPHPFVYVSGRYDKEWHKATVAYPLAPAPHHNVLVYDLRHDPAAFVDLSEKELADKVFATWEQRQAEDFVALPVKALQYNRCPAVAPVGVLEQADGWRRIGLSQALVEKHRAIITQHPAFAQRVSRVFERARDYSASADPEAQLYDGFLNEHDRTHVAAVRGATEHQLGDFHPPFQDKRLAELLLHYKARQFPRSLSEDEMQRWEQWRIGHLNQQLPAVLQALQRLAAADITDDQRFMLSEIQLWIERVSPQDF